MKKLPVLLLVLSASIMCQAQLAVGKWRDHLSYYTLNKVVDAGNRVYASANGGLIYYDKEDYTLNRLNKTTLLNDVGISTFNYDKATGYLVIAYTNSNVDIVKDDAVRNINDIKRNNIGGNKQIRKIAFHNHNVYLACAFGIVVIDPVRNEIKETYYLGDEGSYMNINDIAFTDSLIVAATDNGIMTARKDNPLLNIVTNWSHDVNSLIAGERITSLCVNDNGKLIVTATGQDTVVYVEESPLSFTPWLSGNIRSVDISNGLVAVSFDNRIELYDNSLHLQKTIGTIDWLSMRSNSSDIDKDNTLWIAHDWAGLVAMDIDDPDNTMSTFVPSSPANDYVYKLTSWNNELMVCPGGHKTTYEGTWLPANVNTYSDNKWRQLNNDNRILDTLLDVTDVAVDPKNQKHKMAAVWGYGILEIDDNKAVELYNDGNSDNALQRFSSGGSLRTGAVAFDMKSNLWATNSLQTNALVERKADGSWHAFNTFEMTGNNEIDHIVCDSIYGLKLFWGRANKIFVHDGDSLMAYINPNNGSRLETSSLSCLVQDHSGNIWIGTNKGIKAIYDLQKVFSNGGHGEMSPVNCSNILFSENGITEYLLAYESVTCIAVDGANRKWVGTSTGGLYLLSANGLQQLEHFTTSNSPLFSDKILTLSIMPWSGELFIGTDKGLQSYRTTATFAYSLPQDDIHAFPNPVRPGYDGPIAIKGFTRNGLVHITDAAGHTVFSTTANGGQAIWYGRTNSGERVASGVYYVFASAEDGKMRSVTKILVVR